MDEKRLTLAFLMDGGAGNRFVQMNFIYSVAKYLQGENVDFVLFGHKSVEFNDLLMKNQPFISAYYTTEKSNMGYDCDAFVQLEFYPDVLNESEAVEVKSPKLHQLLSCWREFSNEPFRRYGFSHPNENYQAYVYGINNNKNVLNGMDALSILGMARSYSWKLDIDDDLDFLRKYRIEDGLYITLQRGATPSSSNKENPRLWPICHYEKLISLLHFYYPDKKIVQLGEESNSERIPGVDVDLLSKTSWNELGIVLKHSWLHIDGDCGMVHYRRAMDAGTSVVLFGHTPAEYCGYDENINITSDGCPHWCARIVDYWMDRCPRGCDVPPCMNAITPGKVFERIVAWDYLNRVKINDREQLDSRNEQLYQDYNILIDEIYKRDFLDNMCILHYEIDKVKVGSLKAHIPVKGRFAISPLKESPAYAMALGDAGIYKSYVDELQKDFGDDIHSVEKCLELYEKLDSEGISQKKYVIVDSNNLIQDGQHRASWFMARNGKDAYIDVLRLYALKDDESHAYFPFDLIKRNSRLVIYGAGVSGKSYVEELKQTKYADIVCLLDRKPDIWNRENSDVICYEPNYMSSLPSNEYDYVVIAIQSRKVAEEVRKFLVEQGVPEEKIVARVLKNK